MELIEALQHIEKRLGQSKLYGYRPYGHPDTLCPDGELFKRMAALPEGEEWVKWSNKPWQLDFHNGGEDHPERMAMTGNRDGKTTCAAAEVAIHMTGMYPDWWEGKRFDKPVLVWTGSPTNSLSRDIIQTELVGGTDDESWGTGWVPRDKLIGKPKFRQCGVSDVVDSFKVRHSSGGVSICITKTYDMGWRKFQGTQPHVIWLDEEPEESSDQGRIYSECRTRIITSNGIMLITFTPLLGMTAICRRFLDESKKSRFLVQATWEDAPHLNEKAKAEALEAYEKSEIEARTKGLPMLGEGRVFDTEEAEISVPPFQIHPHFAKIKGIDFGINHPSALADCAWDRDRDVFYVTRTWKKNGVGVYDLHCDEINRIDPWVPVAWPHDGARHDPKSGQRLKDYYANDKGVRMLSLSARYKNDVGSRQPVEPIILEMQQRAREGRLKVFSTCKDFFDEYRNYHRKDGKIVNRFDDVLKAVMYALMMRRYAALSRARTVPQKAPRALSIR